MLVRLAWKGPPALACKLAMAGTPAQPRFTALQEKNIRHGQKVKVCRFQFRLRSIVNVYCCHDSVIFNLLS